MSNRSLITLIFLICVTASVLGQSVDFADDVQPILRRNCFRCHGSRSQEGGMQLDRRADAFGSGDSNEPVVVPGDASASLLIARVTDRSYGDLMPPDGNRLSDNEIDVLRQWIDQGADWPDELAEAKHWAYQPLTRPGIGDGLPSAGAIDYFIGERLKKKELQPSPATDRARLIRRLSLALTGIPPMRAEVNAFLDDDSPDAYEKVVDRLLRSPRYGERWAIPWLDLARYADSNGYQADQIRDNWAYRDWVVRSFNSDLPFDDFVIDQLAGDLRPDATLDQKIATGFHRMTTVNVEAGVHPEADRTNQIVDRVNTTATVFMGTTLECAQCHDHKYDPFTQEDYYRLFAYFNNTPLEVRNTSGVTWDFYGPTMDLPMSDALTAQVARLESELESAKQKRRDLESNSEAEFAAWRKSLAESEAGDVTWQPIVPTVFWSSGNETFDVQPDGAVLLTGEVPDKVDHVFTFEATDIPITAIRVDLLTDARIPGKGPGRGDPKRTNVILSELSCELVSGNETTPLSLHSSAADFSQTKWDVSGAIDGDKKTGWAFAPQYGKPHWASFQFGKPVSFIDAKVQLRVSLGQYYGGGRVAGKPRISIFTGDPKTLGLDADMIRLARKEKPSKRDLKKLRTAFDKSNPELKKTDSIIARLSKQIETLKPDTTLVMVEMESPRETHVLTRGDYEQPAQRVDADTPSMLPGIERSEKTGDRLELARWLTSPSNPLLPRVTVNRWWAEFFGKGIVTTLEDFGTQAEFPSHPELLDWLASELVDSGWSMKHVHKLIVMSVAFQRDSAVTSALLQLDPTNRLLARGPRFRMPAELVRDNALAISGLLSTKMYGEPIMPFQPANLWRSVGRNQPKWIAAENEDRFRRGLYVVWKRAAPYPSFINFDAPDRGSCTVNRPRTNTPLQALTLLNDPAYAEMALGFADRILSESTGKSDRERIAFALQTAWSRTANETELSILNRLLDEERKFLNDNPAMVDQRIQHLFESMTLSAQDRGELAAWFAVANTILNLDEVMSY